MNSTNVINSQPQVNSMNLLIVDDEVNILQSMKRSFKRTGINVFTAPSAFEGLKIVEQENIQVVLSDFRMPQMSGGELVSELKTNHPEIVSMIISGYADFDSAVDVLNSGAAYKFLSKPWTNSALLVEVENAFSEYQKRKADTQVSQLGSDEKSGNKAIFEYALNNLLESDSAFAVASFRLYDLGLLENQHAESQPMQVVQQKLQDYLSDGAQTYLVESDQIFVLDPGFRSESELQNALLALSEKLNTSININGEDIKLNYSLSYAIAPFDGATSHDLMLNLHSVMEPKNMLNKVVRIDGEHLANRRRQLTIQSSIKRALNENQFQLYFQPKVQFDTGEIKSAEILMRWNHRDLGWVPPLEFINLSELDGQIEHIGCWLIENSIAQLAELKRKGYQLDSLAINISTRQLTDFRIVDQFAYLIEKYQVDPGCIEIEVTESNVMEDLQQASNVLWQLKSLGLIIAIDDFGAGYSSFAYLSKLPVDVLKLDKLLIDDITVSGDVQKMLHSMVKLCHQMEIKVVAEGVENHAQLALLKQTQCDYIQGFVFSHAVTLSEFEKQLINQPFKNH